MEEEKETEELGEAPKQEVKVWGLGVLLNKFDKLLKQNSDVINLLRHMENKIESLMDEKAQARHERIKGRF